MKILFLIFFCPCYSKTRMYYENDIVMPYSAQVDGIIIANPQNPPPTLTERELLRNKILNNLLNIHAEVDFIHIEFEKTLRKFILDFVYRKDTATIINSIDCDIDFNDFTKNMQVLEDFEELKKIFIITKHKEKEERDESDSIKDYEWNRISYVLDYIKKKHNTIIKEFYNNLKEGNITKHNYVSEYEMTFKKYNPDFQSKILLSYSEYELLVFLINEFVTLEGENKRALVFEIIIHYCKKIKVPEKYNPLYVERNQIEKLRTLDPNNSKNSNEISEIQDQVKTQYHKKTKDFQHVISIMLLKFISLQMYDLKPLDYDNSMNFQQWLKNTEAKAFFYDLYFLNLKMAESLRLFNTTNDFFMENPFFLKTKLLHFTAFAIRFHCLTLKNFVSSLIKISHSKIYIESINNSFNVEDFGNDYLTFLKCTISHEIFFRFFSYRFQFLCHDVYPHSLDAFCIEFISFRDYKTLDHDNKKYRFDDRFNDLKNEIIYFHTDCYKKLMVFLSESSLLYPQFTSLLKYSMLLKDLRAQIQFVLKLNFLSFRDEFPNYIENIKKERECGVSNQGKTNNIYLLYILADLIVKFNDFMRNKIKINDYFISLETNIIDPADERKTIDKNILNELENCNSFFTELEFEILSCDFRDEEILYIYEMLYSDIDILITNQNTETNEFNHKQSASVITFSRNNITNALLQPLHHPKMQYFLGQLNKVENIFWQIHFINYFNVNNKEIGLSKVSAKCLRAKSANIVINHDGQGFLYELMSIFIPSYQRNRELIRPKWLSITFVTEIVFRKQELNIVVYLITNKFRNSIHFIDDEHNYKYMGKVRKNKISILNKEGVSFEDEMELFFYLFLNQKNYILEKKDLYMKYEANKTTLSYQIFRIKNELSFDEFVSALEGFILLKERSDDENEEPIVLI